MRTERQEILHLLKTGRSDQVQALVEQEKRKNYSNEFVPFMDEMLKEYKLSRKQVAIRSGLSQDYLYKVLRGDKHTNERDYILAMCFAIGMTLGQTQHALASYGMPTLSEGDLRSHIIMLAIQQRDDIDALNEMLEKAGFPLLKTSPEMPSAPIVDTMPSYSESEEQPASPRPTPRTFEEIDAYTDGHHNGGNAPFDYDYEGWIRLKDPQGQIYQVEAIFAMEHTSFLVFTQEQRKKAEQVMLRRQEVMNDLYENHKEDFQTPEGELDKERMDLFFDYLCSEQEDLKDPEWLEAYESLEEAAGSEFFRYFLELDKRTDKKVQEVMHKIDDTREYGSRCGMSWRGSRPQIHIEVFNQENPELREYFQIVEYSDGEIHYTATHESCYMQLEMGQELHELYFGYKREPEFYLNADKEGFDKLNRRHRFIFHWMLFELHEFALNNKGFFELDPVQVKEEHLECFIEQAVEARFKGKYEQSLALLKSAIDILEELGAPEKRDLAEYICTCVKIAVTLGETGKAKEEEEWWRKIYAQKDLVIAYGKRPDREEDSYLTSISVITEAVMHFYHLCQRQAPEKTPEYLNEALDLIQNYRACEEDWEVRFEVFAAHAYQIEGENLELSQEEYQMALTIARNHHLDQNPSTALMMATIYYHYAWLLWNRCGSEEAILHYGRAIDLLESYLFNKIVEPEKVKRELERTGTAMNQLYLDLHRPKESKRLIKRLAKDGVVIPSEKN